MTASALKKIAFALAAFLCCARANAQPARATAPIVVQTAHTALVFRIGERERMYQCYLGERLSDYTELSAGTREAYVAAGTNDVLEPAIRAVHADGNPSLDFKYTGHTSATDGNVTTTTIRFKDSIYPVELAIVARAYAAEDVISLSATLRHAEAAPLQVSGIASSMLRFAAGNYWLGQFHGAWAREMGFEETEISSGIKVIDSKLGTRADMYQAPVFQLSLNEKAGEYSGEVISGALAWSGNFRFAFEEEPDGSLRVISGINPYGSPYSLPAGQTFTTPAFLFTYSNSGRWTASDRLQRWARRYGLHDGAGDRMVVANNWETTKFAFTEKNLSALIHAAGGLGADLFLLDDGWFGNNFPRDNPRSGLGDWQVNGAKLPGGLRLLIDSCQANGMKFGLWIEPEMVNPRSDLYSRHPDWVLRLPNRPEDYRRNQLLLDLSNPAVQDFVFGVIDTLLRQNPGLGYFKWDSNREMSSAYSVYQGRNQSNLYTDYVLGLYRVLERVRRKYPALPMMLCSSGGSRIDYGALPYFTEFWASDNTDPVERIYLHWGYSHFYPAVALASHVTAWGKQSLKYRTDVAMLGRLGYDIDLAGLSETDLAFSREAIRLYKSLRATLWRGTQYRLLSPYSGNRAAFQYVDSTRAEAIVFSFTLYSRFREPFGSLRLQGLDPVRKYKVEEVNLYPGTTSKFRYSGKLFSGEFLMKVGLNITPADAVTSAVFRLTAL